MVDSQLDLLKQGDNKAESSQLVKSKKKKKTEKEKKTNRKKREKEKTEWRSCCLRDQQDLWWGESATKNTSEEPQEFKLWAYLEKLFLLFILCHRLFVIVKKSVANCTPRNSQVDFNKDCKL